MALDLWRGYELLLERLHAVQGGVNISGQMRTVELVLVDDFSEKSRARATAQYLAADLGMNLLLGLFGSGPSNEVAAVSHAKNATLVVPRATLTAVFKDRPGVVFGVQPHRFMEPALRIIRGRASTLAYLAGVGHAVWKDTCAIVPVLANKYGLSFVGSSVAAAEGGPGSIKAALLELKAFEPDFVVLRSYCAFQDKAFEAMKRTDFMPKALLAMFPITRLPTLTIANTSWNGRQRSSAEPTSRSSAVNRGRDRAQRPALMQRRRLQAAPPSSKG